MLADKDEATLSLLLGSKRNADTDIHFHSHSAASDTGIPAPPKKLIPSFKRPRLATPYNPTSTTQQTPVAEPAKSVSSNPLLGGIRKALQPLKQQQAQQAPVRHTTGPVTYVTGLYTKRELLQKKKAGKKWSDGILQLDTTSWIAVLYDSDGKAVYKGKTTAKTTPQNGDQIELGANVFEADRHLAAEEFKSGSCFLHGAATGVQQPAPAVQPVIKKGFVPVGRGNQPPPTAGGHRTAPSALHDPLDPFAFVVNPDQVNSQQSLVSTVVPVVLDPYLAKQLRPHQKEGLKFMYECVMGLREPDKTGCILADEMGLGKTLQVISLAWTLLRQGPDGKPAARKVLIVTPASLCNNWAKEFKKWLGTERISTLVLSQGPEAAQQVQDFCHGTVTKVMITSYETIRKHVPPLTGVFDLLVCDEGHRLKAAQGNKTIDALLQLQCRRRVILSGTPVQNNLDEFFAMIDFVATDLLGSISTFKRVYGAPISRSRDADASNAERELGAARAAEMQRIVNRFVLRRTSELLSKHLPPLSSFVLFCKPSNVQVRLYQQLLRSSLVSNLLTGTTAVDPAAALSAICSLRKLCNHPTLLKLGDDVDAEEEAPAQHASSAKAKPSQKASKGSSLETAALLASSGVDASELDAIASSAKLHCLSSLLQHILGGEAATGDKVVVVSNSTAALDVVDALLCRPAGIPTARIDGGTGVNDRQSVVDNFNLHGVGKVFLLSTRAGGAGLNLVGANHLVLFDSDWNPAADKQAMARIWRDGQRKPCCIYRMLTAGTIEEKIFQRQLMKGELADATMLAAAPGGGAGTDGRRFSRDELRRLFAAPLDTASETWELLRDKPQEGGFAWTVVEDGMEVDGQHPAVVAAAGSGVLTCVAEALGKSADVEQDG